MVKVKLRQAKFSDYAAIAKLHADNWRQNYRGILSDRFLDKQVEQDRLDTWYKRLQFPEENQATTVAVMHKNIVGFSCLFLDDDPVFGSLLDNLHVSSTLQRSGIGKLLIKDCAKHICNRSDDKKMYLWVYEANINARHIYERLGGTKFEIAKKQNEDGTKSNACRYIWNDACVLIL